MSVEDSGLYTPAGFGGAQFRDFIIWPPGWKPPASTETIALDTSPSPNITISSDGKAVRGGVTSSGEVWKAMNNLPMSHRAGWVPGSSAGTYTTGQTLPLYRLPRFVTNHVPFRGVPIANAHVDQAPSREPTLVVYTTVRQRASGVATIVLLNSLHGFAVGNIVTISELGGVGYNGTFEITGLAYGNSAIVYNNPGPDESWTTDTSGFASLYPDDFYLRMHQFGYVIGGLIASQTGAKSFAPLIGPRQADLNGNRAGTDSPYNSQDWDRKGVKLRRCFFFRVPIDPPTILGSVPSIWYNVWAPLASIDNVNKVFSLCPDFAVDADLPTFGTIRVVWIEGVPHVCYPSEVGAEPYPGCTLTGRPRSHMDTIFGVSQNIAYIKIPEDNGRVRSVACAGTPAFPTSSANINSQFSIRASMIDTQKIVDAGITVNAPNTFTSATKQWYRYRATTGWTALGSPVAASVSSYVFGPNTQHYVNDTIPPPVDPSWGDNPGLYGILFSYSYNLAGTPTVYNAPIEPCCGQYWYTDGLGGSYRIGSNNVIPPLHPWPFDVPRMAFAADETDCRYVGNPGWLMPAMSLPAISLAAPTLGRSPTAVTATSGATSVVDATESVVASAVTNAIKVQAKVAGINVTVAGDTATNAGFSGQVLDVECMSTVQFRGSHALSGSTLSNINSAPLNDTIMAKTVVSLP